MDKVEYWKQVPDEPLIEASNLGRLRMKARPMAVYAGGTGNARKEFPAHEMRPWTQTTGYLVVSFMLARKTYKRFVHRLVARAFVDGYFEGATVDHIDGNRLNNLPENLEWVSLAENSRRQNAAGRGAQFGDKHHGVKIKEAQLESVYAMRASGLSFAKIAKHFNVSLALIYKICNGSRRVKPSLSAPA